MGSDLRRHLACAHNPDYCHRAGGERKKKRQAGAGAEQSHKLCTNGKRANTTA